MKKKALSLLLSVLLCALLVPVMATAAYAGACQHSNVTSSNVCEDCREQMAAKVAILNGSLPKTLRYYTTVTEAVENVPENGIVMLCAPLTENIVLNNNKTYTFDARTGGAENASISITAGTVELIGKFGTVSVGTAANIKVSFFGTTFKCLMTTKDGGVGDLLSGDWGFKTDDENEGYAWHDGTCSKNSLYDVTMDTLPLTSVTAAVSAGSAALTYGYGETACALSAQVAEDGFNDGEVTYEWYVGSTPLEGSSNFAFPTGKAVGTYIVTCVATKDGYSRESNEVTVTVAPAAVTGRDFTIDEKPYDGRAVSADTGDAGIALYAALSLSSLTGMALVHKKKK